MSRTVLVRLMEMTISMLRTLFTNRADLALENLALRQQVAALKRERPRPRLDELDRTFWTVLKDSWAGWMDALILVKPDTVIRWHRERHNRYWRNRISKKKGRPRIPIEIRNHIRRIALENPTWGSPRIQAELVKLGYKVSEATVNRYRPKRPPDPTRRL